MIAGEAGEEETDGFAGLASKSVIALCLVFVQFLHHDPGNNQHWLTHPCRGEGRRREGEGEKERKGERKDGEKGGREREDGRDGRVKKGTRVQTDTWTPNSHQIREAFTGLLTS